MERGIPYARQDFFRGETFRDLAEMQTRALGWARDIAGTRLHGTTRQVPRLVFERVEQPTLLPLAPEPFDRPTLAWATVHPDHHIQFGRALYSVPTRYLRQRVEVRGDSRLVRIYHHGELIKGHVPQPPGGRATDYTDYPAERAPYAMRAPEACGEARAYLLKAEAESVVQAKRSRLRRDHRDSERLAAQARRAAETCALS